jgi:hypothetical protein
MPYPPTGSQTIVATASGTMDRGIGGGSQTFKGVGGINITAFTNVTTATTVSTTLTAALPGMLVGFTFVKSSSSSTDYDSLTSPSGIVEDVNCTGNANSATKNLVLGHASVPAGASTFTVTKVGASGQAMNVVAILTSDVGQAFWLGTLTDTASLTTYTFSGAKLGPESPNRLIVVTISQTQGTARDVSTVTVGGVTATLITQTGTSGRPCWMYAAVVPTGLTGDIVVVYTGGVTGSICNVFVGYPVNATPVDASSGSSSGSNSQSLADMAKTAGGFTIIGGFIQNLGTTVVFTQNGPAADVILECSDQSFDGAVSASAAFHNNTASTTTDDYTAQWSASASNAISVGTWGPPAGPPTSGIVELTRGTTISGSTNANTTYTGLSVNLPVESPTRLVIALIHGRSGTSGRTLVSCTIGGIVAKIDAQITSDLSGSTVVAIASAIVPTGTVVNVSPAFSGAMVDCAVFGSAIDNYNSINPVDIATVQQTTGANLSLGPNLNWQDKGYVVAFMSSNTNGPSTGTWTGATEYIDEMFNTAHQLSAAYVQPTSDALGNTISVLNTVAGPRQALVAVAYR